MSNRNHLSDWQLDQARCDINIVIHNLQRLAEKDSSYEDMLELAQDLRCLIIRRINKNQTLLRIRLNTQNKTAGL